MKLAVSAREEGLAARVDQRFGRCPFFIIFDTADGGVRTLTNPGGENTGGAGIQSSQTLIKEKVDCVLVGNIGPNAVTVLQGAGIKLYTGISGTVEQSIASYKEGKLKELNTANVRSHAGKSGGR